MFFLVTPMNFKSLATILAVALFSLLFSTSTALAQGFDVQNETTVDPGQGTVTRDGTPVNPGQGTVTTTIDGVVVSTNAQYTPTDHKPGGEAIEPQSFSDRVIETTMSMGVFAVELGEDATNKAEVMAAIAINELKEIDLTKVTKWGKKQLENSPAGKLLEKLDQHKVTTSSIESPKADPQNDPEKGSGTDKDQTNVEGVAHHRARETVEAIVHYRAHKEKFKKSVSEMIEAFEDHGMTKPEATALVASLEKDGTETKKDPAVKNSSEARLPSNNSGDPRLSGKSCNNSKGEERSRLGCLYFYRMETFEECLAYAPSNAGVTDAACYSRHSREMGPKGCEKTTKKWSCAMEGEEHIENVEVKLNCEGAEDGERCRDVVVRKPNRFELVDPSAIRFECDNGKWIRNARNGECVVLNKVEECIDFKSEGSNQCEVFFKEMDDSKIKTGLCKKQAGCFDWNTSSSEKDDDHQSPESDNQTTTAPINPDGMVAIACTEADVWTNKENANSSRGCTVQYKNGTTKHYLKTCKEASSSCVDRITTQVGTPENKPTEQETTEETNSSDSNVELSSTTEPQSCTTGLQEVFCDFSGEGKTEKVRFNINCEDKVSGGVCRNNVLKSFNRYELLEMDGIRFSCNDGKWSADHKDDYTCEINNRVDYCLSNGGATDSDSTCELHFKNSEVRKLSGKMCKKRNGCFPWNIRTPSAQTPDLKVSWCHQTYNWVGHNDPNNGHVCSVKYSDNSTKQFDSECSKASAGCHSNNTGYGKSSSGDTNDSQTTSGNNSGKNTTQTKPVTNSSKTPVAKLPTPSTPTKVVEPKAVNNTVTSPREAKMCYQTHEWIDHGHADNGPRCKIEYSDNTSSSHKMECVKANSACVWPIVRFQK